MGFGKFLFGGLCAVGAVIAAPAVGTALLVSGPVCAVGAGLSLATGGAATAVAAGAAGVTGTAIANSVEKSKKQKEEDARRAGYNQGLSVAQEKCEQLERENLKLKNEVERLKSQYESVLTEKDMKIAEQANLLLELKVQTKATIALKDSLIKECMNRIAELEGFSTPEEEERRQYYVKLKNTLKSQAA